MSESAYLVHDVRSRQLGDGSAAAEAVAVCKAAETPTAALTVSRWIAGGKKNLRPMDVEALLAVWGYPKDHEVTVQLVQLVHAAKQRGFIQRHSWFDLYRFDLFLRLERDSRAVRTYESSLVPGLLQTPAYADAVVRASLPGADEPGIAERVKVRMERQLILRRPRNPVELEALIDEGALRRRPADPATMREQLEHLLVAQTWPNVSIRVLPFADGPHEASASGPFVLLSFADGAERFRGIGQIGYQETLSGAVYGETQQEAEQFEAVLGHLGRRALAPEASSELIRATIDRQ